MKEYKIKNTYIVTRDEHGQPLNRNFSRAARLDDRDIDELIGLCKGIVCDGVVTVDEAMFLSKWLENNKYLSGQWPVNVLSARMAGILNDNIIDDSEIREHPQICPLLHLNGVGCGSSIQDSGRTNFVRASKDHGIL